jgi:hypothetical protein
VPCQPVLDMGKQLAFTSLLDSSSLAFRKGLFNFFSHRFWSLLIFPGQRLLCCVFGNGMDKLTVERMGLKGRLGDAGVMVVKDGGLGGNEEGLSGSDDGAGAI